MKIKYSILWLILYFCGQVVPVQAADILASIRPLALVAQEVAGEHASVETLINQTQDPHSFALRPSDMLKISNAGVVLWVGKDLERFLVKPLVGRSSIELAPLFVRPSQYNPQGHDHAPSIDAHLWLDPLKVSRIMQVVATYLINQKPLYADYFRARLAAAQRRLNALDIELHKQLGPYEQFFFSAAHDAYGNFSGAFGLKKKLAISVLPEQRLSLKRMTEVSQQIQNSRCLLVEKGYASGYRLAKRFDIRAVETDILAGDESIKTIYDFFRQMGNAFENCLSYAPSR